MDLLNILKSLSDRVLGWALIGLGALLLLLGYVGVHNTAYVVEQLPYVISGGLGGLFLLGIGTMLLLSADLRDQWRVLVDIRDELSQGRTSAPFTDELPTEVVGRRVRS
ncbi:MAG: hypothetical protein JWO12_2845 [Frankiales bacterium]|nr:hypothetical protein [Frankiales bacterium]